MNNNRINKLKMAIAAFFIGFIISFIFSEWQICDEQINVQDDSTLIDNSPSAVFLANSFCG
jgi:hypothetical protein